MTSGATFTVLPVEGIGEVRAGDDLAALLSGAGLRDGDVVVVTSKVVSKAEGRVVAGTREESLPAETDRVVARRGPTSIVRTHHGLVMAAAGIDGSNVEPGTVVLLPVDPDESARALRAALRQAYAVNVAVVVSDTSGRAWRNGQTDIAIGAAGLVVLDDHAGLSDTHGNELAVTAPALADEVAGAGDLVKGKLSGVPVAVVRGLSHLVLAVGEDGPGASALVRPEAEDMFGYGAREAVHRALTGGGPGFGAPGGAAEVTAAVSEVLARPARAGSDGVEVDLHEPGDDAWARGRAHGRLESLLAAYSWEVGADSVGESVRIRPRTP